nr:MAG: hypothetical protein J07AB56_10400 [Candidatus Nanosalinarum sp. J07AB56]
MTEVAGSNWRITRPGAALVIGISAAYLYMAALSSGLLAAMGVAAAGGLSYGLGSKLSSVDRFEAIGKPVSGVLGMASGVLLLASSGLLAFTYLGSFESVLSSSSGIVSLVRTLVVTAVGMTGILTGTYLAAAGSSIVPWDGLGSKMHIEARKGDLVFVGVLAGITVFSVFGTALLRDIPVGRYLAEAVGFVLSTGSFPSVVAGALIFVSYVAASRAWSSLPVREMVGSSNADLYDRLAKIQKVAKWTVLPLASVAVAANDFVSVAYLQPLSVLAAPGLRRVLLYLLAASVSVSLLVKVLQSVTGSRERLKSLVPYVVFGGVAWLVATLLAAVLQDVTQMLPGVVRSNVLPPVEGIGYRNAVLAAMTAASGTSLGIKSAAATFRALGFVPEGLEGATLSAAGVFLVSVGTSLVGGAPAGVLFVGVASSLVIWQIGKRSAVLGREIGRSGGSLQVEMVQFATKLGAALVAVLAARTLYIAASRLSIPSLQGGSAAAVFAISAVGVALLTFSLRSLN